MNKKSIRETFRFRETRRKNKINKILFCTKGMKNKGLILILILLLCCKFEFNQFSTHNVIRKFFFFGEFISKSFIKAIK